MLHFELNPKKDIWKPSEKFLDSQDLHQMFSFYPDYAFIPWLYNFTIGEYLVYIKKAIKYFNVVVHNFHNTRVTLIPRSGYLVSQHDTFISAKSTFIIIVKDMIKDYDSKYGVLNYGLPF